MKRTCDVSVQVRLIFVLVVGLGLIVAPSSYTFNFGVEMQQGDHDPEKAPSARDCLFLDTEGAAKGLHKKCRMQATSAGVAKGDFNGDGFADLAVGAPGETLGNAVEAGAVNVIYGSASGLTATDSSVPDAQFWTQNSVLELSQSNANFGQALASGDFDGDGFSDLAIGAPGRTVNNRGDAGRIYVLFGTSSGLTTSRRQFIDMASIGLVAEADAQFGRALTWGDFDGDGAGDLAIGAPGSSLSSLGQNLNIQAAGMVIVLNGKKASGGLAGKLITNSPIIIHQNAGTVDAQNFGDSARAFDNFGSVLSAGDFDQDSTSDLVIGVPLDSSSAAGGIVHVIPGSTTGLDRFRVRILNGPSVSPNFGSSRFGAALAVGDFTGDSFPDLAVGLPRRVLETANVPEVGHVQIFFGSPGGVSLNANQFFRQGLDGILDNPDAFDHFGSALVAGFFNDDGFADLAIGVPGERNGAGNNGAAGGAVNVIYGSANGLSAAAGPGNQFFSQETTGISGSSQDGDEFGATLTAWNFGRDQVVAGPVIGTFHKVRTADLVIGIPGETLPNSHGVNQSDAGRVVVIYGSVSGLTTTGNQQWKQDSPGIPGPTANVFDTGEHIKTGNRFGAALY